MNINIHPHIFKIELVIEDYGEFNRFMTMLNFTAHSLDATRMVNEIADNIRSKLMPVYIDINQDNQPVTSSRSGID